MPERITRRDLFRQGNGAGQVARLRALDDLDVLVGGAPRASRWTAITASRLGPSARQKTLPVTGSYQYFR